MRIPSGPMQNSYHSVIFSMTLFFGIFSLGDAQPITSVSLNSFILGDTNGSDKNIYTAFSKIDIIEPQIGVGGQALYSLLIPEADLNTNLELSTCLGTEFDTYLALLSGNPITTSPTVIAESGNDLACRSDEKRAYISTVVSSGLYYILLTGNGSEQGKYNLTITGSPATPTPVPWGLDRIDQRFLPLNEQYTVSDSGDNVHVYVVDSGIRVSHQEFEGRAVEGFDFVNGRSNSARDCTGHGTHVAGIIAGKNFGVAKKANLIGVRVFGCNNEARISDLVDAIGWVILDSRLNSRQNVVITLMFSSASSNSAILQSTIRALIRSGFLVVVPAGNNAANSCDFYPGSLDEFLTVGSTDITDDRSTFSNFGNCTNLYAPGGAVTSSWHNSDSSWKTVSGTAQATAHMVGIVSNFLKLNGPLEADVTNSVIQSISTSNVVKNVPRNISTRFAFVRTVPEFSGTPPPSRKVFLFFILQFGSGLPSSEESSTLEFIQNFYADLLSKKKSFVTVSLGENNNLNESKTIKVRVEEDERRASVSFAILERSIGAEKATLEKSLGRSFSVEEHPWAVDSKQIVFWGAPSFLEAESSSLSGGAIAGIVIGVLCIVVVIAAIAWIAYRKATKLDEVKSMEGSADFERAPAHFNDFEDNDGANTVRRSFRNVFKALSFSRNGSMRSSSSFHMGSSHGMGNTNNRMEGQVHGNENMRMASFGGEAFAGLDLGSRSSFAAGSASDDGRSWVSGRVNSNSLSQSNLSTFSSYSSKTDSKGPDIDIDPETFKMQSFGGEAFAIMRMDSNAVNNPEQSASMSSKDISSSAVENDIDKSEAFDDEALAAIALSQNENSFFAEK